MSLPLSRISEFFQLTLRLEGRSVSGDQFRAASDRVAFFATRSAFLFTADRSSIQLLLSITSTTPIIREIEYTDCKHELDIMHSCPVDLS
ncbi:hypothetical protein EA472_12225 [Natrarchaeobius oligotrophus]|uniref:Uncharacterized protein n=1 Tax=Natrarchaeobius chitinivorans TaxID=1679083 RepID=A0A3N6M8F7_NATCH|nr:hypothetical protein EA472_12225 [Natrarchaeobius chitinivorans]